MQDIQRELVEPLCRKLACCRMCKSTKLTDYLDLGQTPPADQFRTPGELDVPEIAYPLRVALCQDCGLSQLTHVVDPRVLYQFDYPYESSITATGKKHWDEFAASVCKRLKLAPDSLVVDIGSNVGTLLSSFKGCGMRIAGIDPAPNIVDIANKEGVPTICDFYSSESAVKTVSDHGKASVIVGTNVFAHIDDLDAVFIANENLLTEDGVFIFESPYFGNLVRELQYDTVYHEHLSYLSLRPVSLLAERFGKEVFAVEESSIHGGAFRVYIGTKGARPIDAGVYEMLEREASSGIHSLETLSVFAERVAQNRSDLMELIERLTSEGKKIAVVSTPAKGMTLLNYCGISNRHIAFATEKARLKVGRYTPGGRIPIVSDEELIHQKADYALLLAWNFAPEIMKNNQAFADQGGKFIIPIPEPRIV